MVLLGCEAGRGPSPVTKSSATNSTDHQADLVRSTQPVLLTGDVVRVVGTDFQWAFYDVGQDAAADTEDDVSLGNKLLLKPSQIVQLEIESTDYVYTLNLPGHPVVAVVPDLPVSVTFQAPDEGRFELLTDPMCGLRYFHDDVLGVIEVVAKEER